MGSTYRTYRPEIQTFLSILVGAILVAYPFTGPRVGVVAAACLIGGLYVMLSSVVIWRQRKALSMQKGASLHPVDDLAPHDHVSVLDKARSVYMLLGMTGEEFQRSVVLSEYFTKRLTDGQPFRILKILLLNPDSPHFAARLLQANPAAEIPRLLQRKKAVIRALHNGLLSLPQGTIEAYEIRVTMDPSPWIMEFTDVRQPDGIIDTVHVIPQLPRQHSRYSTKYVLSGPSPLLFAAEEFFREKWEAARPLTADGNPPPVHDELPKRLAVIALVARDLVWDLQTVEREAIHASLRILRPNVEYHALRELPRQGNSRLDALREYAATIGLEPLSESELTDALAYCSNYCIVNSSRVTVKPVFSTLVDAFKGRYRIVVISDAPSPEVTELARRTGIMEGFDMAYGSPLTKVGALRRIVEEVVAPQCVLLVGSSPDDASAAEAVGASHLSYRSHQIVEGEGESFNAILTDILRIDGRIAALVPDSEAKV
jgi:FMN phosphatase YigB (HAD superfamily)